MPEVEMHGDGEVLAMISPNANELGKMKKPKVGPWVCRLRSKVSSLRAAMLRSLSNSSPTPLDRWMTYG